MYNNDPSDIRGLEEVFQSRQFGRTSESAAGPEAARSAAFQESIFGREFGRGRRPPAPMLRSGENGEGDGSSIQPPDAAVSADAPFAAGAEPELPSALVGMGHGDEGAQSSAGPPKRETNKYWAIAALSAVAALVAAGVTSGAGQHGLPSISAQAHRPHARPHHGSSPSGPASTGTAAAAGGSLVDAAGSGAPSSAVHSGRPSGSSGSASAPGGHVTLIGAATTTGTPIGSPTASSGGSPAGTVGNPGSPPPSGGGNPVAPVATSVGSTVTAVGASVATVANQVGGSIPGTSSVTNAVGTVFDNLGQAVSSSTG